MPPQLVNTENKSQFSPAVKPNISYEKGSNTLFEAQASPDLSIREIPSNSLFEGGFPHDSGTGDEPQHAKNIFSYLRAQPRLTVGSDGFGAPLNQPDCTSWKSRFQPYPNISRSSRKNVIQRENGSPPPLILDPSFAVLESSVDPARNTPVRDWLEQNTERIRSQLFSRDTVFRMIRREVPEAIELCDEEIEQAISQWATERDIRFLAEDVIPSLRPAPEFRQSAVAIRSWLEGNFLDIRTLGIAQIIVRLRRNVEEALDMHDSELSRIIGDWLSNRPLPSEEEDFSLSDLVRIESSYVTVVIPQRVRVRLPARFRDITLFTFQFQATPSSLSMSCEFEISHHLTLSISGSLADYIPSISPSEEDEESPYRPRVSTGITLSSQRRIQSADAISRLRALYTAGREFQGQMRTLMGQSSETREVERTDVERITSVAEEALRSSVEEPESSAQPEAAPSSPEERTEYHLPDFAEDLYRVLSPLLDMYNAIEEYNEGQETPVWAIRAFAGVVTEEFRESAGSYGGIELILHF